VAVAYVGGGITQRTTSESMRIMGVTAKVSTT
jgi:hypothetical protein